ncbi:MAG: exodeoxyribonuclease III [Pseudomonadota bacterium]
MRIATWNINGLRARLEYLCLWLEQRQPDLVGLQELKILDEHFPHEVLEGLGYHALVYGEKAWNGVAILSREPAEELHRGLPGQEAFGARLLSARVGSMIFETVYCPNGKTLEHADFPRKLAWFDSLLAHWRERHQPDEDIVLCGDFNIAPDAMDSWRGADGEGHLFHTAEERARLAALLELGLHDLYRYRHPEGREFSWWDYRGGAFHRGQGLRIDLLLASAPVAERTLDVVIDRDFRKKQSGLTASDHAPVYADLDVMP